MSSITHNDQAYIWRLADYSGIECFLSGIHWLDFVSQYPISAPQLWCAFVAVLHAAVDLYVPRFKSSSLHRASKIPRSSDIRKCLAKKRALWKKIKNNRCDTYL